MAAALRVAITCDLMSLPLLLMLSCHIALITGQCGPVPTILNGAPQSSPDTSAEGDVIKYICDTGYEFTTENNPSYEITCDGGSWASIDDCQKVNCPQLPADAAPAGHATTYGSQVTLSCTDVTKRVPGAPVGESLTVTCKENKQWDNYDPAAEPDGCVTIACPPVPNNDITSDNSAVGDEILFLCREGYVFDDGANSESLTLRCGADAIWTTVSGPVLTGLSCIALECDDLATFYNLTHATLSTSERAVGTTTKASCLQGHEFNDTSVEKKFNCMSFNQTWDPAPEDCLPKRCSAVKDIEYSTVSSYDNWYQSSVNYTCFEGFHFPDGSTSRVITCTKYGSWTAEVPECTNRTITVSVSGFNLATELENAQTFGIALMSVVGVLLLIVLILDILTFRKQLEFLKKSLSYVCTCLKEDDDSSDLDSLDGDEIMRSSTISLGHGRITPAPSTIDLQMPDKSKQSSMNVINEETGEKVEGEEKTEDGEEETATWKSTVPRTRLTSAKTTIQKALARTMKLNKYVRSMNAKQRNRFQSAALPLGADNYGKVIEARPPSPLKNEGGESEDDSSEYTDSSSEEEGNTV